MDKLLLIGINHKVAPAARRERLAFNPTGTIRALQILSPQLQEKDEVALLSTCNRTELFFFVDDPVASEKVGIKFFCETGQISKKELTDIIYIHRGNEATHHLLRVAAGLDSLVVGENEIQGQVRNATELAQAAGTSGPILNALLRAAVHTGKRVRTETEIGKTRFSVAALVVELAAERMGDLKQHTALLIGAGKISTLTARELVGAGLRCVLVANRTFERAQKLVQNLGGQNANAVHFDQMDVFLPTTDIVICSTGAPHIVLHKKSVEHAMENRPQKPMLIIDLAIPRDADPAIDTIPNVELHAMDDLAGLVQDRHPLTADALHEAEAIIESEFSSFKAWYDSRAAVPIIRSLRAKTEAIVNTEIERTLRRMETLSPEQRESIETMGRSIVNKLLHEPTICLKNQNDTLQLRETMGLVQSLFGLKQTKNSS